MIKTSSQMSLSFSKYTKLYDLLIDEKKFWKQLNDMVDFSFVVDMLKDKYSTTMGITCEDVIRMFKYLLLKYFLGYDCLKVIPKEEQKKSEAYKIVELINKIYNRKYK